MKILASLLLSSLLPAAVWGEGDEGHVHGTSCACAAQEMEFTIDCSAQQVMVDALAELALANCLGDCESEVCKKNYYIIQAHHDYCLDADLPESVEDGLHLYESACDDCMILPKFDPSLSACPPHSCSDNSGNDAYGLLLVNNCASDCSSDVCKSNYQTLLAVHDLCDEDALEFATEVGFHDMEESCNNLHACNLSTAEKDADQLVCTIDPEWSGTFALSDETHTWSMQSVDGEYADPSMKLVIFASSDTDQDAIEDNEATAGTLMSGECQDVQADGTISGITASGVCYNLVVGSTSTSLYSMDTTGLSGVVIFAQHVPTEFEDDQHYFFDSSGTDIEPVVQEGGGGHGHGHGHGGHGGHGGHEGHAHGTTCACAAQDYEFAIDCSAQQVMVDALAELALANCLGDCESEVCKKNYYIIQAHHDYCLDADLPESVEDGLHLYESACDDCMILPKFDPSLSACPPHSCSDNSGNDAYGLLLVNNCASDCSSDVCKSNYQTLLAVHDLCDEDALEFATEVGFHDMEESCNNLHACNLSTAEKDADQLVCTIAFEWAGTFALSDETHTWSMQSVDGEYADPSMRLVIFASSDTDQDAIEDNEATAGTLMSGECEMVVAGGIISGITAEGGCYELVAGSASTSLYTMITAGLSGVVIFAQHVPTEFERDQHYLFDSSGTDIEPIAEEGGGGHGHGHGHGHDAEPCACAAIEHGFNIDCDNKELMVNAVTILGSLGCEADCSTEICKTNFLFIQTHHDYCFENELADEVEDALHRFETNCEECTIEPKFNPDLEDCPPYDCNDGSGNAAYLALIAEGCTTDCTGNTNCKANFQTLMSVHDMCDENALSLQAELGFHDVEEACGMYHCNLGDGSTDGDQLICNEDVEDPSEGGDSPGTGLNLCFSGMSSVQLEDGNTISMKNLQIGDRVQVSEDGKFDTVHSFGHYQQDAVAEYLRIQSTAKASPITISAPHMLFLDNNKAVPASFIKVGDVLLGGNTVTKIDTVSLKGAFAPFTNSGTIVVNGVVASNYVSLTGTTSYLGIDMQLIAHTAVTIRRMACQLNICNEESYNEEGVATWIPLRTASFLASQEVGVGCLVIAMGAFAFTSSRRRQVKNVV